jgi:REP element-mobilizing transposase RayT
MGSRLGSATEAAILRLRVRPARRRRRRGSQQPQLTLCFRTWGGARPGAGRPKKPGAGASTSSGLATRGISRCTSPCAWSKRWPACARPGCFRKVRRALTEARERFGFRLVHYSVQRDHLHLIAEAKDRLSLSRGMKGLGVRLARGMNQLFGRRGRVVSDRYHARALKTPLEVKHALLYVLNNIRKHANKWNRRLPTGWLDPCSSASSFDGWIGVHQPRAGPGSRDSTAPANPWRTVGGATQCVPPRSWLLRIGWRRRGLLLVDAIPG